MSSDLNKYLSLSNCIKYIDQEFNTGRPFLYRITIDDNHLYNIMFIDHNPESKIQPDMNYWKVPQSKKQLMKEFVDTWFEIYKN